MLLHGRPVPWANKIKPTLIQILVTEENTQNRRNLLRFGKDGEKPLLNPAYQPDD